MLGIMCKDATLYENTQSAIGFVLVTDFSYFFVAYNLITTKIFTVILKYLCGKWDKKMILKNFVTSLFTHNSQ